MYAQDVSQVAHASHTYIHTSDSYYVDIFLHAGLYVCNRKKHAQVYHPPKKGIETHWKQKREDALWFGQIILLSGGQSSTRVAVRVLQSKRPGQIFADPPSILLQNHINVHGAAVQILPDKYDTWEYWILSHVVSLSCSAPGCKSLNVILVAQNDC